LCCTGPSLKGVQDVRGPGRLVLALNTAYPTVIPDMWIGMDNPRCFNRYLFDTPIPKFMRYGHYGKTLDGKLVSSYPGVCFLTNTRAKEVSDIFTRNKAGDHFVWFAHTLGTSIHLLMWLGCRTIRFLGCDLGGKTAYCHEGVLNKDLQARNKNLYQQQIKFLDKVVSLGGSDYSFISGTPGSPINDFMPFEPVEPLGPWEIPRDHFYPHVHELGGINRLGVVTPTRGDRRVFMSMLQGMMAGQVVKPHAWVVVDRSPAHNGIDLFERITEGVESLRGMGCDSVAVMEDDDYYPPGYIKHILDSWKHPAEIVGGSCVNYYHIGLGRYVKWKTHMDTKGDKIGPPLHSMGFTISAWDAFISSKPHIRGGSLDIALWDWAVKNMVPRSLIPEPGVLSIKHGMGMCGGGNHNISMWKDRKEDVGYTYLSSVVPEPYLSFYKSRRLAMPRRDVEIK